MFPVRLSLQPSEQTDVDLLQFLFKQFLSLHPPKIQEPFPGKQCCSIQLLEQEISQLIPQKFFLQPKTKVMCINYTNVNYVGF